MPNPSAVAIDSPARNVQYVLIRGKEIAVVSTTVTAINREKGILDARARISSEPRRYFGKLLIATNRNRLLIARCNVLIEERRKKKYLLSSLVQCKKYNNNNE